MYLSIEYDLFMVNDEENLIKIDVKAESNGVCDGERGLPRKSKNLRVRINDTNEKNILRKKFNKKNLKPRNCQKIVFIFILVILLFLFSGILVYFFGN